LSSTGRKDKKNRGVVVSHILDQDKSTKVSPTCKSFHTVFYIS